MHMLMLTRYAPKRTNDFSENIITWLVVLVPVVCFGFVRALRQQTVFYRNGSTESLEAVNRRHLPSCSLFSICGCFVEFISWTNKTTATAGVFSVFNSIVYLCFMISQQTVNEEWNERTKNWSQHPNEAIWCCVACSTVKKWVTVLVSFFSQTQTL